MTDRSQEPVTIEAFRAVTDQIAGEQLVQLAALRGLHRAVVAALASLARGLDAAGILSAQSFVERLAERTATLPALEAQPQNIADLEQQTRLAELRALQSLADELATVPSQKRHRKFAVLDGGASTTRKG